MSQSIEVAPPNSFVVISDPAGGEIPRDDRAAIRSTSSCIVVGCLMFADGPSRFTLCRGAEVGQHGPPAIDGDLETPTLAVAVSTSEGDVLMQAAVSAKVTRVRIWTDHPTEPEDIVIGIE